MSILYTYGIMRWNRMNHVLYHITRDYVITAATTCNNNNNNNNNNDNNETTTTASKVQYEFVNKQIVHPLKLLPRIVNGQ